MAISHAYSNSWKYSFCESCLKNSHKEEKMVLKKIISPNDESKFQDLFVCTQCGYTRKL